MAETLSPREMLARLVGFPTVSRDSNLALVDFVEAFLQGLGVTTRRVPSADGRKANLYAVIGPQVPGGVVLSGHTDVVPVDGQDWSADPFTLVERDGKLFGRGAVDMKGFVALCLAAVPKMLAAPLARPIVIALSYDEEVGHLGVDDMIREMDARLPPPAAVFVGEPTMMQVVSQHKAGLGLRTHVRGFEVHSSRLHTGVSAITEAARLVLWHAEMTEKNLAEARALGPDAPGALFDPPCTTLHNGLIEGGTAVNITAKDCRFTSDIRVLPTEDPADWLARYRELCAQAEARMQTVHPETGIDIEVPFNAPGCRREEGSAAEVLARALTGDNAEHAVPYGTEAGNFQRAGHSVVVIGPGSIDQAHQPDEYITVEQFEAGAAFIDRLIARLCE
ncbi:MAG: acetylornithine deacetylase [Alphaproteobacteria bacterium]|nr:MAG: acetylornithine deacetylase [Alphaproteobacteria bacterium]